VGVSLGTADTSGLLVSSCPTFSDQPGCRPLSGVAPVVDRGVDLPPPAGESSLTVFLFSGASAISPRRVVKARLGLLSGLVVGKNEGRPGPPEIDPDRPTHHDLDRSVYITVPSAPFLAQREHLLLRSLGLRMGPSVTSSRFKIPPRYHFCRRGDVWLEPAAPDQAVHVEQASHPHLFWGKVLRTSLETGEAEHGD
jgi:hypothetical protein